jgi:hypothetical protein
VDTFTSVVLQKSRTGGGGGVAAHLLCCWRGFVDVSTSAAPHNSTACEQTANVFVGADPLAWHLL